MPRFTRFAMLLVCAAILSAFLPGKAAVAGSYLYWTGTGSISYSLTSTANWVSTNSAEKYPNYNDVYECYDSRGTAQTSVVANGTNNAYYIDVGVYYTPAAGSFATAANYTISATNGNTLGLESYSAGSNDTNNFGEGSGGYGAGICALTIGGSGTNTISAPISIDSGNTGTKGFTINNLDTVGPLLISGNINGDASTAGYLPVTIEGTGNTTFSGLLFNTNTFTKTGAGTLTWSPTGVALPTSSTVVLNAGVTNITGSESVATFDVNGGTTNITGTFFTTGKTEVGVNASGGVLNWNATGSFVPSPANFVSVGDGGSNCTLNVTGGSLLMNPGTDRLVIGLNGTGDQLNVSGGTMTVVGSGNVDIGGDPQYTNVTSSGTMNINGGLTVINPSGAASISIGNRNSGTNSVTGVLNLAAGTLQTSHSITSEGGTNVTGILNFNGGLLQAAGSNSNWISGLTAAYVFAGANIDTQSYSMTIKQNLLTGNGNDGGLTKYGTGMLTLTGSNTYTGGTNITAGTLQLGNGTAGNDPSLGTSGISNSGSLVYNVYGNQAANYGISGNGGLTKAGSGTLTMTGNYNYSYTGATTISAGTLQLGDGTYGHDPSLATSGITTNATLLYNVNSVQTPNYIVAGSGSLALQGGGTLNLNLVNTYSGGTALNAGTLVLGSSGAIGTGPLTITGGALDSSVGSGLVNGNNNPQNWNGDFTFVGSNNLNLGNGPVTLGGNRNVTVSNNTLTVGGVISGSGYGITLLGGGTLALGGANTFSGTTAVSNGSLVLLNQFALQNSTVAGGAGIVFDQSVSGNFAFGGLSGNTSLSLQDNAGNAVALTVGGNTQNTTYSGSLLSNGSLIKTGSGALTLTGPNTYTGATSINQGTVKLAGGSLANTSGVTIAGGATLAVIGSSGNTIAGGVAVVGAIDMTQDNSPTTVLNISGSLSLGGHSGNQTAQLSFDLNPYSNASDVINVGGALKGLSGGAAINIGTAPLNSGTYTLINYGSESGLTVGTNLTVGTHPLELATFNLSLGGSALTLSVVGNPVPNLAYWTGIQGRTVRLGRLQRHHDQLGD